MSIPKNTVLWIAFLLVVCMVGIAALVWSTRDHADTHIQTILDHPLPIGSYGTYQLSSDLSTLLPGNAYEQSQKGFVLVEPPIKDQVINAGDHALVVYPISGTATTISIPIPFGWYQDATTQGITLFASSSKKMIDSPVVFSVGELDLRAEGVKNMTDFAATLDKKTEKELSGEGLSASSNSKILPGGSIVQIIQFPGGDGEYLAQMIIQRYMVDPKESTRLITVDAAFSKESFVQQYLPLVGKIFSDIKIDDSL